MALPGRVLCKHVASWTHAPFRAVPSFILHFSLEVEQPLPLGAGVLVSDKPGRYEEKRISRRRIKFGDANRRSRWNEIAERQLDLQVLLDTRPAVGAGIESVVLDRTHVLLLSASRYGDIPSLRSAIVKVFGRHTWTH